MSEEIKKRFEIPVSHSLQRTGGSREQRKGQDADIDIYDELDAVGDVVASYEVRESMSIYPPFTNTVTVTKLG